MIIACFGDSLTFGSLGHSYLEYLDKDFKVKNEGLNGDTAVCMHARLKHYITRASNSKTDLYIIAIGTNDLLLPYLATVSPFWKIPMSSRVRYKKCSEKSSSFECEYEKILQTVTSSGKRAFVLGLPYLQLKDYPNDSVDERNKIIKNLAAKYGIPFVDTVDIQHHIIDHMNVSYSWKYGFPLRLAEGILLPILPCLKDYLSDKRRLELTIDGVHWSSKTARAVAAAVSVYISS